MQCKIIFYHKIVIKSINPSQKGREEFYNLAKGYEITVIYFVNNGRGHNASWDKPVKDISPCILKI